MATVDHRRRRRAAGESIAAQPGDRRLSFPRGARATAVQVWLRWAWSIHIYANGCCCKIPADHVRSVPRPCSISPPDAERRVAQRLKELAPALASTAVREAH